MSSVYKVGTKGRLIYVIVYIVRSVQIDGMLLPPANEVWCIVMFLHLSVSHSVHGAQGDRMNLPWMQTPLWM